MENKKIITTLLSKGEFVDSLSSCVNHYLCSHNCNEACPIACTITVPLCSAAGGCAGLFGVPIFGAAHSLTSIFSGIAVGAVVGTVASTSAVATYVACCQKKSDQTNTIDCYTHQPSLDSRAVIKQPSGRGGTYFFAQAALSHPDIELSAGTGSVVNYGGGCHDDGHFRVSVEHATQEVDPCHNVTRMILA